MSFTIVRNLEQVPSYPRLQKLAGQNHVLISGNEQKGSFSSGHVAGVYQFRDQGLFGEFAGHGVKGEFCFEQGKATLTIIEKPFWLPESLLKQKITEGLDTIWAKLAQPD